MEVLKNRSQDLNVIDFQLSDCNIKAIDHGLKVGDKPVYCVYINSKNHGPYCLCSKTNEQKMYEIAHQLADEWL